MPRSRYPVGNDGGMRPAPKERKTCIFEDILSDHVCSKVGEERAKYDQALLRASNLLQQTRRLRSQVRQLTDDYYGLEGRLQQVTGLHSKFRRAAQERLDYLERESYLGGMIAYLMAQHREKELLVPLWFPPREWWRLKMPGTPRHARTRRVLYRHLSGQHAD